MLEYNYDHQEQVLDSFAMLGHMFEDPVTKILNNIICILVFSNLLIQYGCKTHLHGFIYFLNVHFNLNYNLKKCHQILKEF
jgi:sorbitol-specific phosphotransferase system component IIC